MSTDCEEGEEELPTPQAEEGYAVDAAFIDLRSDRERQAYALVKDRVFANTKELNPNLLEKRGMDTEFDSVSQTLGWEDLVPVQEVGSRPTTIQFLCTLQEDVSGISF
jgi:hypothetical protein